MTSRSTVYQGQVYIAAYRNNPAAGRMLFMWPAQFAHRVAEILSQGQPTEAPVDLGDGWTVMMTDDELWLIHTDDGVDIDDGMHELTAALLADFRRGARSSFMTCSVPWPENASGLKGADLPTGFAKRYLR